MGKPSHKADFERNSMLLREAKNGALRRVPMISELPALLKTLNASCHFDTPGSPVLVVDEAQKSIDSAARKAGIPRPTHHDLRHLFATTLIEHGIDIPTVARLTGHKDGGALAMRTYGHLRDEHAQRGDGPSVLSRGSRTKRNSYARDLVTASANAD